ncbi:N protein [Eelpout rhabdovirus]|uniref:Nucleoprotein n=1 Tax=Eelpout rhabdovirus TaxID=1736767 RepID=A0AAC8WAD7_9RHAB|nr:N protein [Eelpout rhabdovirus]ALJ30355.1 N protein [Eelpout rhabdovirus]
MSTQVIKRIATGNTVDAVLPATATQATYPKDGIIGSKRPAVVVEYAGVEFKKIKSWLLANIDGRKLDADLVVRYIVSVCQTWIETNGAEVWNTFGIDLATPGQKINPLVTLEVTVGDKPVPDYQLAGPGPEVNDKALVILLLGIYRVAGITNETYRSKVADAIQQQAIQADPKVTQSMRVLQANKHLLSNPNYLKVVAAVDMFLYRFKDSEHVNVRVSTLTSRFKDCAALSTFAHIAAFTGLTLGGVLDWVFSDGIAAEVDRMMRPGQEIDQETSYMPYLKDMGLSKVSPYSATKNPGFHIWGQTACALMGSVRSQNALRVSEDNWVNLKLNAEIMAFALGSSAELVKAFDVDGGSQGMDTAEEEYGQEIDEDVATGHPKGRDATEWFMYMKAKDFVLSEVIREGLRKMVASIKNPRPNTIGDVLKNSVY